MSNTDSNYEMNGILMGQEARRRRTPQEKITIVQQTLNPGMSERIQTDNGSVFISKSLDQWAYENGVTMDFSRPGKPTDNPFIESFTGSFGKNA